MKKAPVKITSIELRKTERIMVIAAMIFSSFAFYKFWLVGQAAKQSSVQNQIEAIKQKEIENQKIYSELQMKSTVLLSRNQVSKNEINLENFKNTNNMSKMLQSVVDGAVSEIFTLKKISLDNSVTENAIRKSHFNIELKSSFIGLSKFLDKLEKKSPWLAIEGVNLERVERDLRQCDAVIKVITYEFMGEEQ